MHKDLHRQGTRAVAINLQFFALSNPLQSSCLMLLAMVVWTGSKQEVQRMKVQVELENLLCAHL